MKKIRMYEALLLILCLVGVLLLSGCDRPVQDEPADGDHTHLPWKLNAVLPGCTTTGLTEGSVCSICDEILVAQEEIPALGHDDVTKLEIIKLYAVTPNCERTGLTEGSACATCGEVLIAQEEIPALGHIEVIDPEIKLTCVDDGRSEGSHCMRCNRILRYQTATGNSVGHRYEDGACTVCGEEIEYSPGLEFTLLDNGSYAVSGLGAFRGAHLVVPPETPDGHPVTEVYYQAFRSFVDLRSVYLPDGIKRIDRDAFEYAYNLSYIRFPETLVDIATSAFDECHSLAQIAIPDEHPTLYVKDGCVIGKQDKTLYFLPNGAQIPTDGSVTRLGSRVLRYYNITEIVLPACIEDIGSAFWGNTTIQSVIVPEGTTRIPQSAFSQCSALQNVVLPSSLRFIERAAFANCSSLESITLPEGVESIGAYAFDDCTKLIEIVLPEGLLEIGDHAFMGCTTLCEIVIPSGVESPGDEMFRGCTALELVIFREGIREVSSKMFYGCTALVEVMLPDTLQKIEGEAFLGCSSLVYINLPKSLQALLRYAFNDCTSLREIELPYIRSPENFHLMFSGCTSLERVTIAEGTTKIAGGMFANCKSLKYIYIPASVSEIEQSAFTASTQLETVEFGGTKEQWQKIKKAIYNDPLFDAELICRK